MPVVSPYDLVSGESVREWPQRHRRPGAFGLRLRLLTIRAMETGWAGASTIGKRCFAMPRRQHFRSPAPTQKNAGKAGFSTGEEERKRYFPATGSKRSVRFRRSNRPTPAPFCGPRLRGRQRKGATTASLPLPAIVRSKRGVLFPTESGDAELARDSWQRRYWQRIPSPVHVSTKVRRPSILCRATACARVPLTSPMPISVDF
jgi:hypothetical protein